MSNLVRFVFLVKNSREQVTFTKNCSIPIEENVKKKNRKKERNWQDTLCGGKKNVNEKSNWIKCTERNEIVGWKEKKMCVRVFDEGVESKDQEGVIKAS